MLLHDYHGTAAHLMCYFYSYSQNERTTNIFGGTDENKQAAKKKRVIFGVIFGLAVTVVAIGLALGLANPKTTNTTSTNLFAPTVKRLAARKNSDTIVPFIPPPDITSLDTNDVLDDIDLEISFLDMSMSMSMMMKGSDDNFIGYLDYITRPNDKSKTSATTTQPNDEESVNITHPNDTSANITHPTAKSTSITRPDDKSSKKSSKLSKKSKAVSCCCIYSLYINHYQSKFVVCLLLT